MRKLIALCALLLSASAAMAQADKAPAVTKLPGEEKLSVRERAERDFLMPMGPADVVELSFFLGEAPSIESAPGGGESRPE